MTLESQSVIGDREPEASIGATAAVSDERPGFVDVVDCTLREGEQTPGVVLRRADKLRLAELLAAAGFGTLEIGMPAISRYEEQTVRQIAALVPCNTHVVCLARKDDILRARDCGVDSVGISLPAGDRQLSAKLQWSKDQVISTAVELTQYAHDLGLKVVLSPYDTPRATLEFLTRYVGSTFRDGHIDQVRLVDTVGCATPALIAYLTRLLRELTDDTVPIEVHCHNDFGLAVANTLAGITAGAAVASTTVNGLGERAGGAASELVVAALELLYGVQTGIRLDQLRAISAAVAQMSGVTPRAYEPIIGQATFMMESGSVIAGYLRDPLVAFPFPPEILGARPTVILGKKSGKQSVAFKATELGFDSLSDVSVSRLLAKVKEEAEASGTYIGDDDFREWVAEEAKTSGAGT